MAATIHFATSIYNAPLQTRGGAKLNAELVTECDQLEAFDIDGRKWSEKNYPGGYTSYASMNELHRFSSTFEGLEKKISKHVKAYAKALDFDLRGREVFMTDCWVNVMPPGVTHSLHLHPLSFISGTYYVSTPVGCPGIKFEDPRLDRFMAAPPRKSKVQPINETFVTCPAVAGNVVLFESWLRHEVAANQTEEERISISFNYGWR
jgi:uncharacterized protein (TIGR02466 family)